MLGKLTILIVLIIVLLGGYMFLAPKETGYTPRTSPLAMETLSPPDWNSYTSPRFNYTFSYPTSWTFNPYDEANPTIQFGSHSLVNYDMSKIEQFMDHGIVDWKTFLGDKPAIKLDIQVYKRDSLAIDEEEYEIITPATMQIGNLATTEKKLQSQMTGQPIHIFETENNGNTIVLGVYVFNSPDLKSVLKSSEGQALGKVFNSFKFN